MILALLKYWGHTAVRERGAAAHMKVCAQFSHVRILRNAGISCILILALVNLRPALLLAGDASGAANGADAKRSVKGNREKLREKTALELSREQALWTALAFEDTTRLKGALAAGVNINTADRLSLMTPLMAAETHDLAQVLLDAGADLKARDRDGRTVLHYAVRTREAARIIGLLTARGADPNWRDNDGNTPLLAAIAAFTEDRNKGRATAAVTALVKAGADPNLAGKKGETPLAKADECADKSLAKLLASLGAKRTSLLIRHPGFS
jgi:hypothetical protein